MDKNSCLNVQPESTTDPEMATIREAVAPRLLDSGTHHDISAWTRTALSNGR